MERLACPSLHTRAHSLDATRIWPMIPSRQQKPWPGCRKSVLELVTMEPSPGQRNPAGKMPDNYNFQRDAQPHGVRTVPCGRQASVRN